MGTARLLACALACSLALGACDPWDWQPYDYDANLWAIRDAGRAPVDEDLRRLPDPAEGVDLALADLAGCPGEPCDPICQSACGQGRKCSLDDSNHNACMPAGAIAPGHFCGLGAVPGNDDCAPGSVCLKVGPAGSVCYRFCRQSSDCPTGSTCGIVVAGSTLSVCTVPRSNCALVPAAAADCEPGTACYPVASDGNSGCHAPGTGVPETPCTTHFDCQPGTACFTKPAGCRTLCRLDTPGDCQAPTTCTPVPDWPTKTGLCL